MPEPHVIEITRGETLFREIGVLNSDRTEIDLSGVGLSVVCSPSIPVADITVTLGDENHIVEIRADGDETALWPGGTYDLQLWLAWPEGEDVEDEVIFAAKIVVRLAPNE